jgi:hypothetical protein
MKLLAAIVCAVAMAAALPCTAKGAGRGGSHAQGSSHSRATPSVARNSHGKIARSAKARDEFKRSHPCPSTGRTSGACPGYVIDHVRPLKRGGADAPSNMQWQTVVAAKAKDRTE